MEQFKKSKVCPIFNLVRDKEGKVNIVVGNYVASKARFDTFDQAERYLGTKPWELIINLIEITMHYEKDQKTTKKSAKASKETAKKRRN